MNRFMAIRGGNNPVFSPLSTHHHTAVIINHDFRKTFKTDLLFPSNFQEFTRRGNEVLTQ